MYNPYDHYFNKAKKDGYKARSAFKLDEIDKKFRIFDKTVKIVIDIGCAPGSWLQYVHKKVSMLTSQSSSNSKTVFKNINSLTTEDEISKKLIIGFDIKQVDVKLPGVYTYKQDITDRIGVSNVFEKHKIKQVDCIISDMAPNTIGVKDIDAIRAFDLLEKSMWIYEELLKKNGKFVTKIFMGPGFDQYVKKMKDTFGGKNIKIFKPDASRTNSKETYVIKI